MSQWNDKSGNGNHAVQGTGSAQPSTGTKTINTVNSLNFNDNYLSLTSSATGIRTAIIVTNDLIGGSFASVPAAAPLYGSKDQDTNDHQYTVVVTGTQSYDISIDGGGSFAGQNGTVYLDNGATGRALGSDGNVNLLPEVDGTTRSAERIWIVVYDNPVQVNYIGRFLGFNASGNLKGDIGEILFYDTVLTTSELNQIGNYLADKWGITWTDIT